MVDTSTPVDKGQRSNFRSILFESGSQSATSWRTEEPAYFSDLNLDQIVESISSGFEEYALNPIFYQPLPDLDAVHYRHEVFRDLEAAEVAQAVKSFAKGMREMREHLAQSSKLHYPRQQQGWFLDAVSVYCDAVRALSDGLHSTEVRSRGLMAFRAHLTAYVESATFVSLVSDTLQITHDLSEVSYLVHIKGNRVRVRRYKSEPDYSAEVEETFERFKQRESKDYRIAFSEWPDMNHVEASILDQVARLYLDVFAALEEYCKRHRNYLDKTIQTFDREVQFYMASLTYTEKFKAAGYAFCYPQVSADSKEILARDTFDLALAGKLVQAASLVVSNDFELSGVERIFVVTGPNQGGKTTFARTFGQLHHLASIGCLVPGTAARLFLFDQLFTHFEKEEESADLVGKLEADLVRLRDIFGEATARSVVIMNEIFTSTTLDDARFLGSEVVKKLVATDLLCVYVTFVDELAGLDQSIVSMVSTVSPENPEQRTFKVVRRPADGLAYALAIAERYGLTYKRLKERLAT